MNFATGEDWYGQVLYGLANALRDRLAYLIGLAGLAGRASGQARGRRLIEAASSALPSAEASTAALVANTAVFESPLSGAVQTLELPGARWALSMSFPALQDPDAGTLMAFLAKLRGRANRFTCHNFARPALKGTGSGTALVKGAGQTGTDDCYSSIHPRRFPHDFVFLRCDLLGTAERIAVKLNKSACVARK